MDLWQEVQSIKSLTNRAIEEQKKRARTKALTEQNYKIANAQFILKEREKGTPATLISQLALGDKEVSKLRFERDIALSDYENANEFIKLKKVELRILNDQIQREWSANVKA